MPCYKLTYFNVRGLAEPSRQLFALAGVEYEDIRLPYDRWLTVKDCDSHLPILEVDERLQIGSFNIVCYLAREFGYAGKDSTEASRVDAIAQAFREYWSSIEQIFGVLFGFSDGDKERTLKECGEPIRDAFFGRVERRLKTSKRGFLVGRDVTWVDLAIADHVDVLYRYAPEFLDNFPQVLAHSARIRFLPKIMDWIERGPKRPF